MKERKVACLFYPDHEHESIDGKFNKKRWRLVTEKVLAQNNEDGKLCSAKVDRDRELSNAACSLAGGAEGWGTRRRTRYKTIRFTFDLETPF